MAKNTIRKDFRTSQNGTGKKKHLNIRIRQTNVLIREVGINCLQGEFYSTIIKDISQMMMVSDRWREFLVHTIQIPTKLKGLGEFWRFDRYNNNDLFVHSSDYTYKSLQCSIINFNLGARACTCGRNCKAWKYFRWRKRQVFNLIYQAFSIFEPYFLSDNPPFEQIKTKCL